MKKLLNKENAITMIALIVTLIVLLFLAGVTIGLATNSTSLFQKAQFATDEYNNKAKQEETEMTSMSNEINEYVIDSRNSYTDEDINRICQQKINSIYRAGAATMPQCSSGGQVTVKVDFTNSFPDANYSVSVVSSYTGANWAQATYTIHDKTASGFTIRMFEWNGTKAAHTVYWTALSYNS